MEPISFFTDSIHTVRAFPTKPPFSIIFIALTEASRAEQISSSKIHLPPCPAHWSSSSPPPNFLSPQPRSSQGAARSRRHRTTPYPLPDPTPSTQAARAEFVPPRASSSRCWCSARVEGDPSGLRLVFFSGKDPYLAWLGCPFLCSVIVGAGRSKG
jgi:hypothetical protein